MFGDKVKIDRDLLARAKEFTKAAGYASVEEFVAHAVEQAMAQHSGEDNVNIDDHAEEETRKRLQGLGYLS